MAAPGRRPPRRSRSAAGIAVLLAPLLLASCELPRFGAPDPASEEGQEVQSLWSGFFLAAVGVAGLVWVLLAFVLIRYRRRGDDDDMPSQKAYNIPLEIFYTAVPVLIVAALFFFSVRTEREITPVSSEPAVEVEVIGFQWGWQFRYLGEGFTVDAPPGELPQLVLPVDQASNLQLVASDVVHSFWVPNFLNKRDLIPGVNNEITVRPNRAGTFVGRCAEFCGLDHWRMGFSVRVVPAEDYERWVADQRAAGGTATSTIPEEPAQEQDADTGTGGYQGPAGEDPSDTSGTGSGG